MRPLRGDEQRELEIWAEVLDRVIYSITGETFSAKSYDPMLCDSLVIHSYAFDLLDGGRHHPVSEFENLDQIKQLMLDEVTTYIIEGFKYGNPL